MVLSMLLLCGLSACVKDKPDPPAQPPPGSDGRRLYIACEGSFGNGNASLSVCNIDKDSIYNDVYAQKNGQPLGDILQSMLIDGDRLYLSVNNSDKIAVTDKSDGRLLGNISVRKPRYMLKVSNEKMYVTSLYFPEVHVVNPQTMQRTGTINTDYPNTEGMAMLQGKVYVCNWDTACNYLYEIDPATDAVTARIPLAGYAPQQVLADKDGNLWVLAGNVYKQKTASLTQVDPRTRAILKSFVFPPGADMIKPCWNPGKDTLYMLGVDYNGGTAHNGVYRMDIHADGLPAAPFIQAAPFQYFWALGIDPVTRLIYVGDPKGFIQSGAINVYQTDGSFVRSLTTGLGPGFLLFEE